MEIKYNNKMGTIPPFICIRANMSKYRCIQTYTWFEDAVELLEYKYPTHLVSLANMFIEKIEYKSNQQELTHTRT